MSTCQSCGGIIGRDCFNPRECAEITAQQAFQSQQLQTEKQQDSAIIAGLAARAGNAELRADELLKTVQLVYRKHCMGYDGIGWDELGGVLLDALCNTMGAEGYEEWKSSLKGGEK